ncbi:peptidoglycan D,D-transpeptidase FtsI family protein [Sphingorhabdus contaminans]|jgi:cell division protein FtsI (penicillin-binding protein 3)|uniref:Penicillin-binding protein 2 n=1 Tax=Sphingorhabdus contaminans TaxID=1343899 RepID=A0A553WHT9_9SPHN|nr:penicillin-binding protein 2 [Sphingorhabdus contaminans]TSB04242.1 penicillin-binding protein 2 [Sphingorhabdus contaminans]
MTILAARTTTRKNGIGTPPFAALGFWRLLVLLAAFGLFVLLLIGRLATLALFESTRAYGATNTDYVPDRGDIVDRNGVPLARSIYGYAIWVKPDQLLGDRKELAKQLAAIFPDTSAAEFYGKLTADKPGYLRKRALPEQVRQVHDLGEIAIEFPREATRLYPQHDMAAHVLGFVNRDGNGAMGMERVMNEHLRNPAKRSKPLNLALDVRVQAALESELLSGMRSNGAKGAAGIVLDVQTGEVVAMATLPSFNPNRPVFANIPDLGETIVDGRYPISRQTNNVTNRVYELGSTFKPLTVAAALDAGTVRDLSIRYDATKPIEIGGFKIRDTHPSGRWLNTPEALIHSSNIVTAQIADNLGAERMDAMLRTMHFNSRPDIELAEKAKSIYPKKWGRLTNMTVGFGHSIAVTPLHLASAYAAMVNGGIYRPATMFKTDPNAKLPGKRVFTAATSARMRQLMRMIVVDGTGRKADALGYRVGGKTGSAEKPGVGGYNRSLVVATFAAAFPMDNPRYVVLAMLDEPKGTAEASFQRTAGYTAAPVVQKTITRIGPLLGIIPDMKRDVDVSELMPLLWKAKGE